MPDSLSVVMQYTGADTRDPGSLQLYMQNSRPAYIIIIIIITSPPLPSSLATLSWSNRYTCPCQAANGQQFAPKCDAQKYATCGYDLCGNETACITVLSQVTTKMEMCFTKKKNRKKTNQLF